MQITGSIIDYIGKYEEGILVSVGLMYNNKFYDAIFYYTKDQMIVNTDRKFREELGFHIQEHEDYLPLMKSLIEQCEPFESIIDQMVDIEKLGE